MLAFWDDLIEPLLDLLRPERILEIGSDRGTTTRALLDYAEEHGTTVHVIDPRPNFDTAELEREHAGRVVFHRALSLEVLPKLEPVDVALIDGDHNWYTVFNELRLLEGRADDERTQPPVIALHDVGWPYGRRDLYYDPESIPADKRSAYERRAIHPDSDDLVEEGINAHLANAVRPAPERSGVLGGIEDFMEKSGRDWELYELAGDHGLGVLIARETLDRRSEIADLLDSTSRPEFLRRRVEALERARIDTEVRRAKAGREATAARKAAEAATAKRKAAEDELAAAREQPRRDKKELYAARDDLDDAERRIARLRRQRDAADEREDELERELAAHRRKLRIAEEEAGAAAAQLASLREEIEEGAGARRDLEERVEALEAKLEGAAVARARLVADFEERRESLERTNDDLRAQADTGRQSAAELREMLEERELEIQRLGNQMLNLQTALGRARAESEIAGSERAALERRLADLAERYEQRLVEAASAPVPLPAPDPGAQPQVPAYRPSRAEREALRSFASEYPPLAGSGRDPLALPSPHDRRGSLRGPSAGSDRPSVDVVVCVHDALDDVRLCLWSLTEKGSYPFRLIVVNDGSGPEATAYLEEAARLNPRMTVIHNDSPPHGYTIAANLGMRAATANYVVLLNSDTIVTPGWLERIVACGESDERIGILGPLSNAASHQSVPRLRDGDAWATNPLPAFATEDGLARLVSRLSPGIHPRVPFVNGFCYVVKRPVFDAIGYFDEENFASGYCEENDFSYRAAQAGFELAVVDDCYVFHAKSKSYTAEARKPIAQRNYEIFLRKHGAEKIQAMVSRLERDTSLSPLRAAVANALSSREEFARSLVEASPLSVDFILPGLGAGGSGGSHSIYQEVRGLRRLGVKARILLAKQAWQRALEAYDDAEELFVPYEDLTALIEKTTGADVISATHYKSIPLLAGVRERREDFLPAYYVQDYEPFFSPRGSANLQEALDSYTAIPDCLLFAKTHWLCNIVSERHGIPVAKVEPSLDADLFRPSGERRQDGPLRVAAMLRPRTPRRQPTVTIAVLEELRSRLGPELEVETFGCTDEEAGQLTDSRHLLSNHRGLLSREDVARLLGRSDVFLDMSIYQAFGRTALEAMACGCTAVVPRLGGVWEFADDGANAAAVDTSTPRGAVEAIAALAGDRECLRNRQAAARQTAARYSIDRAALSEYLLFSHEHARRFEADRAAA
jgi:GT2 family glycosyltransferase